jgi:hypothetical protein
VAWVDADGVVFASGDQEVEAIETGGDTAAGAMPSVAVTPDGTAAYLSWYDTENEDLIVGAYGELELVIAEPSPEPDPPEGGQGPPTQCTDVEDGRVHVVAQNVAFDINCIRALAGEPFTIEFENLDPAPQTHNLSVYPTPEDLQNPIVADAPFSGPQTVEYEVPALDVGQNSFQCDIHPTTMTGVVDVVEELGEGGGGTGATGATAATGGTGTTGATGGTGTT